MLKLYDYWRSTASFRVRMALAYKFIPYEAESIHLVKNGGEQHSEKYAKINPSELVPTLVLPSGDHISQSLAIMTYLEDAYPEPSLLPSIGIEKYRALDIAGIIGSDLHPLNNLRVLQFLQSEFDVDDQQKMKWYTHWVKKGFEAVEAKLQHWPQKGDNAVGDDITIADIFIVAQIYNAERFNIPVSEYKRIQTIYDTCKEQAWYQKAYPQEPS